MTKRLSIIALIISICAVICGLFFVNVDEMIYEWNNGPMLVSADFFAKAYKAQCTDNKFFWQYHFCAVDNNCQFDKRIDKNRIEVGILQNADSKYSIEIRTWKIRDINNTVCYDGLDTSKPFSTLSDVNMKVMNRYIDNWFFPDKRARREKKQEILNQIDELNKEAELKKALPLGNGRTLLDAY